MQLLTITWSVLSKENDSRNDSHPLLRLLCLHIVLTFIETLSFPVGAEKFEGTEKLISAIILLVGVGSKPTQMLALCLRVGLEPTPTSYRMILLRDFFSALKIFRPYQ